MLEISSSRCTGKLKKFNKNKIKFKGPQKIKVKITKEKNQGCSAFGSCLIKGIKNTESPKWLKDKILVIRSKTNLSNSRCNKLYNV